MQRGFQEGSQEIRMRQVICCDEGREDMRSEVRERSRVTGSETRCRQMCLRLTGSSLEPGRGAC